MSEFSKQYVEKCDNNMPYDFDIDQIYKELQPDHYKMQICEGYGFIAIAKLHDQCKVAFPITTVDRSLNLVQWMPLSLVNEWTHKKFAKNNGKIVTILTQDECAPDSLEYFAKQFEQVVEMPFDLWRESAKRMPCDDDQHIEVMGDYRLYQDAYDQVWKLQRDITKPPVTVTNSTNP